MTLFCGQRVALREVRPVREPAGPTVVDDGPDSTPVELMPADVCSGATERALVNEGHANTLRS